ncbi:MAG: MFS transporter [Chloroflexota bacterium]
MTAQADAAGNITGFRRRDYFKITIFGFAITALWQSLHTVILPLRILDFVPEAQKNTYLGLLTFAGLVLGMLVQPLAGAASDRAPWRWGKRRPYILFGTVAALVLLPGLGLAGSYLVLFLAYALLQVSTNAAQGPYQGFIPDMVPAGKRGRASGVKSFLEVAGGVALIYPVALLMDRYFLSGSAAWLWFALGALGLTLLIAMMATMMLVRENPLTGGPPPPLLTALRDAFRIDLRKHRDFAWFLGSRLLVFMGFTTIQQFALNFLRDVIGVTSPAEATARFSLIAVAGMFVIVYPAGHLADRLGRRPVNIASSLLGAAGIGIIFLTQQYVPTLLAAGVIGLAIGAFNSSNWALANDLLPEREGARFLGLANMATAGGAALARLIGPLIDVLNRQDGTLGYQVMLLACFGYFVLGALLITRIGARR